MRPAVLALLVVVLNLGHAPGTALADKILTDSAVMPAMRLFMVVEAVSFVVAALVLHPVAGYLNHQEQGKT